MLDVRDKALSQGRHDVLVQHQPVMGNRHRVTVHLDILAEIAPGEIGDGRVGRWLRRNRRGLSLPNPGDRLGGGLADTFDGDAGVAMNGETETPGTAEGASLDDESLLAGEVDADAKTGKIAVPEDGVLAVDGERACGGVLT